MVRQALWSVVLFGALLLILGAGAIAVIYWNQKRYLARMQKIEERIRAAKELTDLGQMAAGVAHEIKNPLNAMGLALQRLKREFTLKEPEKQGEYENFIRVLYDEIKRIGRIVEDFLKLARPTPLNPRPQKVEEVLKDVVVLFKGEAQEKKIDLGLEPPPPLPGFAADREQLTQALINLVKNALESTDSGGSITLKARVEAQWLLIQVSDTGKGMEEALLPQAFQPHFTTKSKGTGLGLSIARQIVEAHGGTLSLKNRAPSGITATIRLPRTG
jgi:signal transduction histidine kinase